MFFSVWRHVQNLRKVSFGIEYVLDMNYVHSLCFSHYTKKCKINQSYSEKYFLVITSK